MYLSFIHISSSGKHPNFLPIYLAYCFLIINFWEFYYIYPYLYLYLYLYMQHTFSASVDEEWILNFVKDYFWIENFIFFLLISLLNGELYQLILEYWTNA